MADDTNNKPRFVGEKVKLGAIVRASSERNKGGRCDLVYSVTNSQGFIPSEEYFSKEVFSKDLNTYRIVKRDMIAYNPSRINVGSVALQDKNDEVVVSPLYVVFSVDESKVAPGYVVRFLKSKPGLDQIAFQSIGTVRNNLKYKALCQMELTLPSLSVQRDRLANFVSIESQISQSRKAIEQLDQLVKSRFVEMFGDPSLPNGRWRVVRLDSFTRVITGNTPSRRKPEYYGEGIEWVKTDNIANSVVTTAVEQLTAAGQGKARVAPAGSILMACIAGSVKSIGKVGLLDREVAFNQQINAIVPEENVDPRFLLVLLTLSKNYLCSSINMQLKGILNKSSLSAKEFPLPPLELQQEFAAFAAQVDKSRFAGQLSALRLTRYG